MSDPTPITPNPIASITSLWTFKAKVITIGSLLLAVTLGMIMFINDYRDTKAKLAEQVAVNSTNSEVMRKLGDSLVAAGHVGTATTVNAQAAAAMSPQVIAEMAAQGAAIRMLVTAVGVLSQQIKTGTPVAVTPGKDGSFQAVNLVQARTGPALTEVKLDYDPAATDASKRLTSNWTSYQESFTTSLGEWQKKDKGYTAAITLKRDVFKDDPKNPGAPVKVGSEVIPLTNAVANYNMDNFTDVAAAPPRWSLMLGAGHDGSAGKNVAVGILGYQLFDNWSGHLGQVGNTTILGGAYHFSLGK